MNSSTGRRHSSGAEHGFGKAGVEGSNPSGGTIYPWRTIALFWRRVNIPDVPHPDSWCWEWKGSLAKGYGQFKVHGWTSRAHRVAYEIARGPIPDGMGVLHSCDNPRCVNPYHLRVGTHQDNMDDKRIRGRVWYGGPRKKADTG